MSALAVGRPGKANKAAVATPSSRPVVSSLASAASTAPAEFSRRPLSRNRTSKSLSLRLGRQFRQRNSFDCDKCEFVFGWRDESFLKSHFSQLLSVRVGTQCEWTSFGGGERRGRREVESHVVAQTSIFRPDFLSELRRSTPITLLLAPNTLRTYTPPSFYQ